MSVFVRTSRLSALLTCAFFVHSALGAGTEDAICAAPLREALMTVRTGTATTTSNAAATAWQCSFRFSSHDDAMSAGLDVGAVVYGVPLQIGGKFDQRKVGQWKDENCSKSAQSQSFGNATYAYLREVAPGAMRAFSDCIIAKSSTKALECTLVREPAVLTVKWRRLDGETGSAAPKVTRIMVTNGTCSPGIAVGTKVAEGGVGTPCISEPKKDLLVMVQTNRGMCAPTAPYAKVVYNVVGTMSLEGDKQIVSDVVEFAPNSQIVTNGRALTISAGEIRLQGAADIRAFSTVSPQRPPGDGGASGGAVLIAAAQVVGGDALKIDLSGQDGMMGATGYTGGRGTAGRKAAGRGLQGIRGCGGGHDADPGGKGAPGGPGGPGGSGGNGGTVVLQLADPTSLSRINVVGRDNKTMPGKGGAPGPAGAGGPGGTGGAGDGGHDGCGGRGGAPNGPTGDPGVAGNVGRDGQPGPITIQ